MVLLVTISQCGNDIPVTKAVLSIKGWSIDISNQSEHDKITWGTSCKPFIMVSITHYFFKLIMWVILPMFYDIIASIILMSHFLNQPLIIGICFHCT